MSWVFTLTSFKQLFVNDQAGYNLLPINYVTVPFETLVERVLKGLGTHVSHGTLRSAAAEVLLI